MGTKSHPTMTKDTKNSLETKRKDLLILIDHITQKESNVDNNDDDHPNDDIVMNCVVSRLMAELQRLEVEIMKQHILSCPGLSRNSVALDVAMPALQDAVDIIAVKEKKMSMSLLTPSALVNSFMSGEDDSMKVSGDGGSSSSPDNSFDQDVHLTGGNKTTTGNTDSNHDDNNDYVALTVESSPNSLSSQQSNTFTESSKTTIKPIKSTSTNTKNKLKAKKKSSSIFGSILRSLFIDVPFAFTTFLLFSCFFARHVYFTFWEPVMESIQWSKQRMDMEYTNYRRQCDESDISTTNVDDLIVDPKTMTAEEAMEVTNKHGMSIFPNVVTEEAAEEMRKWIIHRNANLNEDDAIPLIGQYQRWSFPIGADQVSKKINWYECSYYVCCI